MQQRTDVLRRIVSHLAGRRQLIFVDALAVVIYEDIIEHLIRSEEPVLTEIAVRHFFVLRLFIRYTCRSKDSVGFRCHVVHHIVERYEICQRLVFFANLRYLRVESQRSFEQLCAILGCQALGFVKTIAQVIYGLAQLYLVNEAEIACICALHCRNQLRFKPILQDAIFSVGNRLLLRVQVFHRMKITVEIIQTHDLRPLQILQLIQQRTNFSLYLSRYVIIVLILLTELVRLYSEHIQSCVQCQNVGLRQAIHRIQNACIPIYTQLQRCKSNSRHRALVQLIHQR